MTTSAGVTSPVADDVQIVRRLLAHIDAGTTDEGEVWREPVQNYLDPKRFADELRMLRSFPSVFIPSAAIPNPGDHVERVCFSTPLFAVRGRDRRARVFRNACRHRGMALVAGTGCAHALVCRYHGWTYRLDGSLAHVPHADAFPGLDPATRGLVEVTSTEADGLIVIGALNPDAALQAHAQDAMTALTEGSAWRDKLVPANRLVAEASVVLAINWKVLVEQFLEGYHIRSTHHETFFPLQYDDLNVVEMFGSNSRITFPYRNIERLRDRPESTWTIGRRVTFVYQLFPNVMLATFPDRTFVIVVDPIDIDHSRITTYTVTTPENAAEQHDGAPSGPTPLDRGVVEDNEMSLGVQLGLQAGANEFVEFGRHESAIGHFHSTLDQRLALLTN
ncbi:Rieske (2Fe-2S) domain-containing protein [Pseudoalteromonas atlantica T6c] [Mycobacterium shimoidei]|uniref:Rieske (2Fe-2S) domain-containing protein [Pseudoalteromonas atlantica T6c] n=1 Tax=Mycobacterium shimoidei TaxID=29313 RepID=A0A375YUK3_MYCSH|nr:SRPBCC family protein [Mycobacterium shimoidei]SRX92603.1 Rieske (2Fe-2S) domain-containing protein [Pseudoalteromonas atlantica T6c] [Mycobacterium shimoidei]